MARDDLGDDAGSTDGADAGDDALGGDDVVELKVGIRADGERVARRGGWGAFLLGVLFALAFCPSSGIFFFGMLVPMAAAASGGWLLPVLFAVATALPVIVVAWLLAYSVGRIGTFYGRMKTIERWTMLIVGALFIAIGLYECYINYL